MAPRSSASFPLHWLVIVWMGTSLAACAGAPAEPTGMPAGGSGGGEAGSSGGGRGGAGGNGKEGRGGSGSGRDADAEAGSGGAGLGQGGAGAGGGNGATDGASPAEAGTNAPDAGSTPPDPGTASEACGKGLPVPKEGVTDIMVKTTSRRFFLRLPQSYDGKKPWPVIFAFHGAGNKTAAWFDTNTDLRAQTEEKAVLIFPEGPERPTGGKSWVYMSPENVIFVDAMVDWAKKNLCIDPSRLFATGQSSGGYMAMTLGCQRGTVFRAVATSSGGILEPGTCNGNPPVFMRTGKADTASTVDSVLKTRDFWVAHKACSKDPPKPVAPAPCVSYSGCQDGVAVIFCEDGGSHGWPNFMTKGIWDLFSSL